jgi:hypothetical protein
MVSDFSRQIQIDCETWKGLLSSPTGPDIPTTRTHKDFSCNTEPLKHRNKRERHLVLFCDFLGPVFIQRESASTSEVLLLALKTLAR